MRRMPVSLAVPNDDSILCIAQGMGPGRGDGERGQGYRKLWQQVGIGIATCCVIQFKPSLILGSSVKGYADQDKGHLYQSLQGEVVSWKETPGCNCLR